MLVVSLLDGAADKLFDNEPGDLSEDGVVFEFDFPGDFGEVASLLRLILSGVEGVSETFLARWRDLGRVSEWFRLSVDAAGVGPWPLLLP